jgi:hypothetical protein
MDTYSASKSALKPFLTCPWLGCADPGSSLNYRTEHLCFNRHRGVYILPLCAHYALEKQGHHNQELNARRQRNQQALGVLR